MATNHPISLPHLTNEMVTGARKTKLCAYAVAIEGWRRGLQLKWYTIDSGKFDNMITFGVNPPGRLFSLSSGDKTHYFFRTRGDKVENSAVEIGSDKDETKIMLSKAGVPVPAGKKFEAEVMDQEILDFAHNIDFPLVLKPTNGSLGNGVITNIKNIHGLKKALKYVREDLDYPEVIVEQYVPGNEYRVYVVDDKVVAAYNRLPASVVGDGEHTIEQLIELKNQERRKNARLVSCLITIDQETIEFIDEAGYNLQSIPTKAEKIPLKEKTNISAGGDSVDVTDELPIELKNIAIDAIKAIPGLYHGGVDIIANPKDPVNTAVVIELNPTAQIGGILFPVKGQARDIPAAIVDYYFPETKGIVTDRSKVYFDLNTVLEPLQSRTGVDVEVSPAPVGSIYAKKYTITGQVQRLTFHRWIKKEALDRGLSGFINNLIEGGIEVIVAGTDNDQVTNFKQVISNYKGIKITSIYAEDWNEPIKVGFEINEGFNISNLRSVETALKKIEKEIKRVEKEKYRFDKEARKIEESRSWRLTKPLRKIGELIRK